MRAQIACSSLTQPGMLSTRLSNRSTVHLATLADRKLRALATVVKIGGNILLYKGVKADRIVEFDGTRATV